MSPARGRLTSPACPCVGRGAIRTWSAWILTTISCGSGLLDRRRPPPRFGGSRALRVSGTPAPTSLGGSRNRFPIGRSGVDSDSESGSEGGDPLDSEERETEELAAAVAEAWAAVAANGRQWRRARQDGPGRAWAQ
eukprot:8683776-Alexandrium_andersonii.AAC.1